MGIFWKYFKKIIFVWGIITLVIFIYLGIFLTASTLKQKQQAQDDKYEKTFNDIKLSVVRKSDQKINNFLLNITKSGKPLINDFSLPIKKYDLDWLEITDASLIPVRENEYRLILYSAVYDCDQESAQYIWLLKVNKQINLIEMITISDMHRIEDKEILIFGNRIISLPSFKGFKYDHVVIPTEIKIGDNIKIEPLLNQSGTDIINNYFKRELQKRKDRLAKLSDTAKLELCKKADRAFDEAISERIIPY